MPYYNVRDLNMSMFENKQFLRVFHINACSIKNKDEILSMLLDDLNDLDVICITETWLSNNDAFKIDNFNSILLGRENKRGGGVAIFINKSFSFNIIENYIDINEDFETITIEIDNIILNLMYRIPSGSYENFIIFYNKFLENFVHLRKTIISLGDFNLDLRNNKSENFMNILTMNGCKNYINMPTRVMETSSTIIDLFISNAIEVISGVLDYHISDHLPIFGLVNCNKNRLQMVKNEIANLRNYSNDNMVKFRERLTKFNWVDVLNEEHPCSAYKVFLNKLQIEYNICFPIIQLKPSKKAKKPWVTNSIIRKIRNKNKLFSKFLRSKNIQDLETFKKYRNSLNSEIRSNKKTYFLNFFANSDPSQTWKKITLMLGKQMSDKKFPNIIIRNNKKEEDITNILNEFNLFVTQLPNIRTLNSREEEYKLLSKPICNSIYFEPVTSKELKKIINDLNIRKGPGFDDVHPKPIKFVTNELIKPLQHIFNSILVSGEIPESLLISRVVMIHKKGAINDFNNYRPISILPLFSKIMEEIIYVRLNSYITKNNIIHTNQYGFQKYKSTELALLKILNHLHEKVEKGLYVLGIFLDLAKAFDTVNHNILLKKLSNIGIRGLAFNFFKNYLKNRKQFIQHNLFKSKLRETVRGVPQGSKLGPLLFLIYINDFFAFSSNPTIFMFADDTTIFYSHSNRIILEDLVNNDMGKLINWYNSNGLSLNISKSKYMIFTNKKDKNNFQPNVLIHGHKIDLCNKFKLLGITIQDNLKWDAHVNQVCTNLSKRIGAVAKIFMFLPKKVLIMLYNAFIYSLIYYCHLVWGKTTCSNLVKINRCQKRYLKFIDDNVSFNKDNYNLNNGFKKYNILSSFVLHDYKLSLLMFKAVKGEELCKVIDIQQNIHRYETRGRGSLRQKKARTNLMYNNINSLGPKLWNSLPIDMTNLNSYNAFKTRLKKHYC